MDEVFLFSGVVQYVFLSLSSMLFHPSTSSAEFLWDVRTDLCLMRRQGPITLPRDAKDALLRVSQQAMMLWPTSDLVGEMAWRGDPLQGHWLLIPYSGIVDICWLPWELFEAPVLVSLLFQRLKIWDDSVESRGSMSTPPLWCLFIPLFLPAAFRESGWVTISSLSSSSICSRSSFLHLPSVFSH